MPAIGLALISNTLFAVTMCLAAEIIRRMRRPALAHAIWALALLKLVTPAVWQVHLAAAPQVSNPTAATYAEPIASPKPVRTQFAPAVALAASPAILTPHTAAPIATPWSFAQILLAIWCGGAVVLLGITILRIRSFRRALRATEPAGQNILCEIRAIALRFDLTGDLRARLATDVCPMIWFIGFRPLMVLPRSILAMHPEPREAIIAHELAHLRRGDHWVRLLELFATITLWWHPLVWLVRHRLRESEEEACDAWVMWAMPHAGKTYAQTLVDMVRVIAGGVPAGASGLGGFGQLQRRLIMILEKSPRKSVGLGGWMIVAMLAASLPLAIARASGTAKAPATQPQAAAATSDATSAAIRGLLDACAENDQELRSTASQSIFAFGDKAIPVLVEGMRNPATVDVSKMLLTNFGPKAVDPLIAELHAKDRLQRLNALQALGAIITPPGNALFGAGLNAPRGAAAYAPLGATPQIIGSAVAPSGPGAAAQTDFHFDYIESAVAELTRDSDTEIRQHAAAMLGSLAPYAKDDSALDRLISLLDDEDKEVRRVTAQSLGMQGPKAAKAVDALTKATSDKEPVVRVAAVTALGAIGPGAKHATTAVTKALKDYEPQVRLAAALALGRMNAAE